MKTWSSKPGVSQSPKEDKQNTTTLFTSSSLRRLSRIVDAESD